MQFDTKKVTEKSSTRIINDYLQTGEASEWFKVKSVVSCSGVAVVATEIDWLNAGSCDVPLEM